MAFEVTRSRWYVQPLDAAVESHTDSQWFYSIIFNNSSLGFIKKLRETQEIGTLKEKKKWWKKMKNNMGTHKGSAVVKIMPRGEKKSSVALWENQSAAQGRDKWNGRSFFYEEQTGACDAALKVLRL